MNNKEIKNALAIAIRLFFTQDEILDQDFLAEAASNYVYEHDEEIRQHLRDQLDMEDVFDSIIDEIDWSDIW